MAYDKKAYMQQWRKDNKDKVKGYKVRDRGNALRRAKEWCLTHPEEAKTRRHREYLKNGDKYKARAKNYREAHPEWARAVKKAWKDNNREYYRKTNAAYCKKKRHVRQEAEAGRPRPTKCELCPSTTRIVFDHCHDVGKFRGWICDKCNRGLGYADHNPERLRRWAEYLEAFRCLPE